MSGRDERQERIEALFHEAVDLPADRQDAFLRERCGEDPSVLEDVRALLAPTHPGIDRLLDSVDSDRRGVTLPERIGPYRVERLLGEGGMAVVYLAEQAEPVRRRVALKLIKPGFDSGPVLQRFEAERQALALMDHPSVAKVFDAGTTEAGRPYFALEFVDGCPVTDYCDRERLDLRSRLELFVRVCEAVQHAHQKGVVHRDLKPSNILVASGSDRPILKVIDFGVAKAIDRKLTDQTLVTAYGQFIGTPEYMSPEQAAGRADIDTRTDVYALGVLLYQMLVGTLPFGSRQLREAGFEGMLRIIREQDPVRPSEHLDTSLDEGPRDDGTQAGRARGSEAPRRTGGFGNAGHKRRTHPRSLVRRLRGDLDWITLKALEKDRDRRYSSAIDLARDVTRHLNHEPVAAGPPTTAYRVRKFVRRHRVTVAAASIVLVSLVATVVVSIRSAVSETRQRRLAAISAERLETVAEFQSSMLEAIDAERLGSSVVGHLRDRIREGMNAREVEPSDVEAALARFDEIIRVANRADLANDIVGREILAPAAAVAGDLYAEDPLLEARLRFIIGKTYSEVGRYDEAFVELSRALELSREHHGREHESTLAVLVSYGTLLARMNRYGEAGSCFREALEAHRRRRGPGHPATLGCLYLLANNVARSDDPRKAEPLFREALRGQRDAGGDEDPRTLEFACGLGRHVHSMGKTTEAEELLGEVVRGRRRVLGEDHADTLDAMVALARCAEDLGRIEEASRLLETAVEGLERRLGADHTNAIAASRSLAVLWAATGRHDEAIERLKRLEERTSRLFGDGHASSIKVKTDLGFALTHAGRYVEAERRYREALELARGRAVAVDAASLEALASLPPILNGLGRHREAEALLRDAIELVRTTLGEDHRLFLGALTNLAGIYQRTGRAAEAEGLLRELLELHRERDGEDHPDAMRLAAGLADTLGRLGRYEEGVALARETLQRQRRILGDEHPETVESMNILGLLLWRAGEGDEARALRVAALEIRRRTLGDDHRDTVRSLADTGVVLQSMGDLDGAEALYREALERGPAVLGPKHPQLLTPRINLGVILVTQGRYEEALSMQRRTIAACRRDLGNDHPTTLKARTGMSSTLQHLGRYGDAAELLRSVLDSQRRTLGEDHPDTLATRAFLGNSLALAGRGDEATAILDPVLARERELFGDRHPRTLSTLVTTSKAHSLADRLDVARAGRRRSPAFGRSVERITRRRSRPTPSSATSSSAPVKARRLSSTTGRPTKASAGGTAKSTRRPC